MNAVVAYMMADWYRPGVTLDYPLGGSGAIVDALVRGLRRSDAERGQRGGHLMLRTHCEQASALITILLTITGYVVLM